MMQISLHFGNIKLSRCMHLQSFLSTESIPVFYKGITAFRLLRSYKTLSLKVCKLKSLGLDFII
jgi:hypothetical protein